MKATNERKKKMIMKIKLDTGAYMPYRAHDLDVGYDLRVPAKSKEAVAYKIPGRGRLKIGTGIHVQLPPGTAGMIKTRSGMNSVGIQCEGVIDPGYTGQIMVTIYNHSNENYTIYTGEKIAQLVIVHVSTPELTEADELEETERGARGFGSTGP